MASPAIEIEGLTKDFPVGFWQAKKRRALDDLSLQVETGEVLGFLGPNGAGKTTTLKLLVGLIFPTAGTARILGHPISDVSMHRKIGFLPEQPYFYDYLTAPELLDYFARFFRLTAAERRERVDRLLKKVGLDGARKIQLRKYSKGMLQRAGLAQAMLHDPEVLILDEPMSGLEPVGRRDDLRPRGRGRRGKTPGSRLTRSNRFGKGPRHGDSLRTARRKAAPGGFGRPSHANREPAPHRGCGSGPV